MPMRRVGVFAGSAAPLAPSYADAATRVGRLLAENGISLLTEGVMTGLEAVLVESAREAGGAVVLLPRDPTLVEKADGILALPQGLLTFDRSEERRVGKEW